MDRSVRGGVSKGLFGAAFALSAAGCGDGDPLARPVAEGPPPDCPPSIAAEGFEAFAAGAELGPGWELVVEGPASSARVNLDAEGHGHFGSLRYALFTNAGSEPNPVQISAATLPVDVRRCTAVRVSASIVVFSLEQTENDHAFVEVRGDDGPWIPMAMPFPSADFPADPACRAGGQDTGCVAFRDLAFDVPRVAMGSRLSVRFRVQTLTAVTDFFGFDDVSVTGFP